MGGARQLLRKLSRAGNAYQSHLHRPCAAFSSGSRKYHQKHQCLSYSRQALRHGSPLSGIPKWLSSGHGSPLSGMPKWLFSAMVSLEDRDCVKFVPSKDVATFSVDSTSTSIYGQCPALSTLSQIRAGGACGSLFRNGYVPMQVASMVRFSSTATSPHLGDDLGDTPGVGGKAEVFSVVNADAAAKLMTPEAQAISEVSTVIGDSSYPTAFLQLLMENVHLHAGLPWWAAIAITTIGIRLLCLPVVGYQLRSAVKLPLTRPEMERINAEITDSSSDPKIAEEGRARIMALFAKHKTTPLSPFIGAVFMCFFFAGRSTNFAANLIHRNQSENIFPVRGVRYYRGGARGRGRTFHDFDREYGQPGERKPFDGREGSVIENRDEIGSGLTRDVGNYKKLDFEEQDRPETPEERLAYMRAREREIMLRKFKTLVIDVNRTFKVTKGGGEISFTALVICGNGDGLAGWAKGKGPKATRAIREASVKALNNLYYFERFKDQTIYHYVEAKYEKTKVRLWPEWTLGKFRAAGIVRGILRLAGIKSVKSKLVGSSNPHNTVKATFLALSKIKTPKEYEEKYWRAVVERHLILDADGKPSPEYRKISSYVL